MTTDAVFTGEQLARLRAAREQYHTSVSPSYDEVLYVVTARVGQSGSFGKDDIGALLFWKRLRADTRWASRLLQLPDRTVREATAPAVQAAMNTGISTLEAASAARSCLSPLPGFKSGDALASALLVAAAPGRMAIYDSRAHAALTTLGLPLSDGRGRYRRYMELVEQLRMAASTDSEAPWLARDVDLALYWLGQPKAKVPGKPEGHERSRA